MPVGAVITDPASGAVRVVGTNTLRKARNAAAWARIMRVLRRGAALTPSEGMFAVDVVRATHWSSRKRQRFDLLFRRVMGASRR